MIARPAAASARHRSLDDTGWRPQSDRHRKATGDRGDREDQQRARYTRRRPNLAASRPPSRIDPPKRGRSRSSPGWWPMATGAARRRSTHPDHGGGHLEGVEQHVGDSSSNSAKPGLHVGDDIATPKWTLVGGVHAMSVRLATPPSIRPKSAQQRAATGGRRKEP